MNTIQGIMEQIKIGQDQISGINGQLPAQAARSGAAPAPAAAPAADSQSIAFNPAQMSSTDLENAHQPLDPERVARLLGLLD